MDRSIAYGWIAAVILLALLTVFARRGLRPWAGRALALLLLYLVTLWLVAAISPMAATLAALAAGAAVLLAVQPPIALGLLDRRALGLTPPVPGSNLAALTAVVLAVALNVAVMMLRGASPVALPGEAVLALLVAPLIEELVFRGVLLALVDRASPPRWKVVGARIGFGGVLLTLAFVSIHGLRPGVLLGIAPAALLYFWLRARTGSLVWPLAGHLAWNLSVIAVHA